MKVLIVVAALAAVLMPVDGALRQCAGTKDKRYESTGFVTADFTQKACKAAGGWIDPNRKGNQKCCNVADDRQWKFNDSCKGQQAADSSIKPTAQAC